MNYKLNLKYFNFTTLSYNNKKNKKNKKIIKNYKKQNYIFKSKRISNLSNSINIYGLKFNSGSFSITKIYNDDNEKEFLLNFRMSNCKIVNINNQDILISLNKIVKIDKNLKVINENKILIPSLLEKITNSINTYNKNIIGIEDMRIFNFNDIIKIIGTAQDTDRKTKIISGDYDYETNKLTNINYIENTFNIQEVEKNWVYFINDKDELNIIYKWYPLQVCNIVENKLFLLKNINMPKYFINARGSTCGVKYNNQNWFIVHFNEEGDYYHFFAVFDLEMKLIKYSNKFKFEGNRIEFCIGFTIDYNDIIICYSLNDEISKYALYDISRLNGLLWIIE